MLHNGRVQHRRIAACLNQFLAADGVPVAAVGGSRVAEQLDKKVGQEVRKQFLQASAFPDDSRCAQWASFSRDCSTRCGS